MPSAIGSALEFSEIQATEIFKYQELRLRITLDGNIQESQESTLDAGVHTWREPFSFDGNLSSQCEIHVLTKKRGFFCYGGRYKAIRTTRPRIVGELLDTRSHDGVIRLPLYDSNRTYGNGVATGSVVFMIADTFATNDGLKRLSTRDSVSWQEPGAASSRSPFPKAVPEKFSLVESDRSSPPPRPKAPTPPASATSEYPTHRPPNVPPQPPLVPSSDVFTPRYLQTSSQLPQFDFAYSPPKSGVDRALSELATRGDAALHPKYVLSPHILFDDTMTAVSSLLDEDEQSGLVPQGSAEVGSFTPVICEAPEDMASEGFADPSFFTPPHTDGPTLQTLPTPSDPLGLSTIPQISITVAKSSRGNSPLAPSSYESDVTIKRPSVHVDTGSSTHLSISPALARSSEFLDVSSPYSHSAVLASPQPTTSTTNTSSSGLSPFSRTSMVESPSTAATTPAQSATSDTPEDAFTSPPSSATKRKERPTIDTSCVGPRGQVRKYRNGSVPPVHVPVKLRNASLELPRYHEYERFEPNPSMYSIAPSISPRHLKKSGDLRSPSSLHPGSRQGFASSTRAPSVRREPLEFDEAQICLDTANLGDQEVATFLKEVDAALSAVVNGSPAVAADSRAFLAVPSANSRFSSRHQSRKPSSQHLRADLSATIRSHEKEGAARTGFSLVATSHPSPHPDVIPSRTVSPLAGHADSIPRLFVSQLDVNAGSTPGSPSRNAVHAFPLQQRMTSQPSPRHELVEWVPSALVSSVSTRAKEPLYLGAADSYYGDV